MRVSDQPMRPSLQSTIDTAKDDILNLNGLHYNFQEAGYDSTGIAALCVNDLDSQRFEDTLAEITNVMNRHKDNVGTETSIHRDRYTEVWIVFEDVPQEFDDLVVAVEFTIDLLDENGYQDNLLAALFQFENRRQAYLVYSFLDNVFYPYAPHPTEEETRDFSAELALEDAIEDDLTLQDDRDKWYPFWPETPGGHPWE